ncbi:hypothetical protein C2G38_136249 [Gigaspora rosea]|uniref:Ergosterol biosynthesis ERG4/ERG24 n=1 Tax=Gigaspora rosea TaxID=44941 RepID=A0A397ULC7_9GLOM|nr:hypothetical protein C2G38_136249 [Gigaspora rosea]
MNQIFTVLVLFLLLGLLLFSFPKDLGDAPPQAISRLTGYKAWHPKVIGYTFQMSDAMTFLAFLTTGVASYLSLKWTEKLPLNKSYASYLIKNGVKVSTFAFNRMIAYYIAATFIAVTAYMLLDVGKLWSATGIVHNIFEIAVMVTLHFGGKIKSHAVFAWIGVYVLITFSLNMWLKWPQDAAWFKVQGVLFYLGYISLPQYSFYRQSFPRHPLPRHNYFPRQYIPRYFYFPGNKNVGELCWGNFFFGT